MLTPRSEFTHVMIRVNGLDQASIGGAFILNGFPSGGTYPWDSHDDYVIDYIPSQLHIQYHYDETDPSVAEVIRRVKAGTCKVRYVYGSDILPEGEEPFYITASHPFHKNNNHLIFHQLIAGEYRPPANNSPAEFHIPGIIIDGTPSRSLRVFQWGTSTPRVPGWPHRGSVSSFLDALRQSGWYQAVPPGKGNLYALDIDYGESVFGAFFTIKHDPIQIASENPIPRRDRIISLSKKYREWEISQPNAVTDSQRNIRNWWRSWLGFAWENKSSVSNIIVSTSAIQSENPETRTIYNDVEAFDWIFVHLEVWMNHGMDDFIRAVSVSGTYLETLLNPSNRRFGTMYDADLGVPYEGYIVGAISSADWTRYTGVNYWQSMGETAPGSLHRISTAPSTTSAVLSWVGGDSITRPVTIAVRYRPTSPTNAEWTEVIVVDTNEVTIRNLSPNTEYEWQGKASNRAGESNWYYPAERFTTLT